MSGSRKNTKSAKNEPIEVQVKNKKDKRSAKKSSKQKLTPAIRR